MASTDGLRPADFKPLDFRSRPDPTDFARVMSGKIPPTDFQPRTFPVSRLPRNPRTNTIGICLFAHQAEPQPMASLASNRQFVCLPRVRRPNP